ncbi:phenylalanyl-tRNA synthetase subunit beta [Amanita rubescens]|nr:phenylalanyl-tRNA synthetase subunit beta [Amanita rubescens]
MPTVAVDKADLWERLGRSYSTEEFDSLCFDYGLELDEDTTEEVEDAIKKGLPAERPQLKIEVPANRYDLLCIEGIARALRIFLEKGEAPRYKLVYPPGGESDLLTVTVHPETSRIRPLFACAILRNVKFTPRSYASFIDLQDKLHQNICRRRQLVAIGTHDLDTLKPPFRYEARAPNNIKFAPLGKNKEYTAEELMTLYESEKHLARYLHIIRDSPVYPIIYDAKDRVLSMPPVINSEHSKITLNTRNIFIDVTATDQTKLDIVVNIVATMFSEYCEVPYTIEPVKVVFPDGRVRICPDLSERKTVARASYVNACTGLDLSVSDVENGDEIQVEVPPTRPDIFHECDIMEDAAIAYGFNKLPDTFPATNTVAQPLAINKLSDCNTQGMCSHEENFAWLNRVDNGDTAIKIANPKSLEFQVVRTTLIPGLLKCIRENRSHALPIKFKDTTRERQARNERRAAAVWCNKTAGFEVVHGLLDRAMKMLEIPRIRSNDLEAETGYYLKETSDPAFFPGRAATIQYRAPQARKQAEDIEIGVLGILHPTVLEKFDIGYPCSALEFSLEPFKKQTPAIWTNDE